jgi:hypothetical protein
MRNVGAQSSVLRHPKVKVGINLSATMADHHRTPVFGVMRNGRNDGAFGQDQQNLSESATLFGGTVTLLCGEGFVTPISLVDCGG